MVKGLLLFSFFFFVFPFIFCNFAPAMNKLFYLLVWLTRIHRCRGGGIQSPTDYAFVRYVVNEHWPYYAYDELTDTDWLTQKLGRLYFRLANWRQPSEMLSDKYRKYWLAGCHYIHFTEQLAKVELARVDIEDYKSLLCLCDDSSVLVVEGINRNRDLWQSLLKDDRIGITFDLYYCGIVFFDNRRYKHHYIINF